MNFVERWRQILMPADGFGVNDLWQIGVVIVLLAIFSRLFRPKQDAIEIERYNPILWAQRNVSFLIIWGILTLTYLVLGKVMGLDVPVFRFFSILGIAWIVIGVLASCLREKFWAESVAGVLYFVVAFFGLARLEDSIRVLEELQFAVGTFSITAWELLAGLLTFGFLLWASLAVASLLENRIAKFPRLSGSLKVLIAKIIRIIFIVVAIMVGVTSMGVDLSALTVFGGAIGLGLGFGLQKVISNFVSGIILLMDNSIKPGDVIEIEGTYGWINNLRARYASVITRDGTEHLIPNEDLITQRVINWSFTDNFVRIRVPIGVSYKSDPHQCIALVLEATGGVERVLKNPEPACHLKGFGDSSVDLELRFWIADPVNGIGSVQSKVLLKIWDTFKEHGIEIPFPQRDLHIRSSEVIPVTREHPDPN